MPVLEPAAAAAGGYTLRHIGPAAAVWPGVPTPPSTGVSVLSKTLVARPLPASSSPASPDLVIGQWIGRLGDTGEMTLTFPNREASDGLPWRNRFDPTGHLQFVEIYDNGQLDSCCVIDKIDPIDVQQVQLHGSDGWFLLKKAYERDWVTVSAPRDVIARGTQVWVPATTDGFRAGSLNAQWTASTLSGGTVGIGANGGLALSLTATLGSQAAITSPAVTVPSTGAWSAQATVQVTNMTGADFLQLKVSESSGDFYSIALQYGTGKLSNGVLVAYTQQIASAPSYSLRLESDGQWVYGFINGQLVGCGRRQNASTTSLQTQVTFDNAGGDPTATATVTGILTEALAPFLMRGTDQGDYVLPGNASTYPVGGLHARYFNDLDLQSATTATQLASVLAPTRTQAYGASSSVPEYMNQQDATIGGQNPPGFTQSTPGPGPAQSGWSAVWFGAVYLKLSGGNYTFSLNAISNQAMRLWVGNTQFGSQIIDAWNFTTTGTVTGTVSAAALAGSLPYGAGTVARDGWYPFKLEVATAIGASRNAPTMTFTPPVSYTDPGGTALTGGTPANVPATSLSPLGCVDQRYQGVSHYDLVQQTGQAYGYQLTVEPKQLESGVFPGVLAPRVREGHDTDIILTPDRGPRQDGEGLLNYSSGLDASDNVSSLQGNGAGFQNGNTGQLQAVVYDPPTLTAALFDMQGWQDFSDASFSSLLQALLNSQLGLRLTPWQLLSADPSPGRARRSYTWPLPGSVAAMRWRPGDGLRVQAPDINVYDTTPRQMLVVTRSFAPNGITGTTATFAARPRTEAKTLKQQLYTATRWQRNYQRQLVTLTGSYQDNVTIAAGASPSSVYSMVSLNPGDLIVGAVVRIAYNLNAAGTAPSGLPIQVWVNNVDRTSVLGGTWTVCPVTIPLLGFGVPDQHNRLYVQIGNPTANAASVIVSWQVLVDVRR